MENDGKYTYEATCEKCDNVFSYTRKYNRYPSEGPRRFCPKCLPSIYAESGRGQKGERGKENYYICKRGYVYIRINGNFVPEHRYVMEKILERPLIKGESVHHKNGIRHDNHPENLELWLQPHLAGIRLTDLICPHCHKPYHSSQLSLSAML